MEGTKSFLCIKDVFTDDTGERCFTEGKVYRVDMGYYFIASNDMGDAHIIGPDDSFDDWFFIEHFKVV